MKNKYKYSPTKKYGWGGDLGKMWLDSMSTPLNMISGQDVYNPNYDTKAFKKIAPMYTGLLDTAGKVGMSMATGGMSGLATGAMKAVPTFQNGGTLKAKTDSIRKQYNVDRSKNDTWLDAPSKALTWAAGYGYKKPSDMLYDKGLAKHAPNSHQELAASIDKALDPVEWLTAMEKAGGQALGSLASTVLKATHAKGIYDYAKSRATDANNWLGETTGYKFEEGGNITPQSIRESKNKTDALAKNNAVELKKEDRLRGLNDLSISQIEDIRKTLLSDRQSYRESDNKYDAYNKNKYGVTEAKIARHQDEQKAIVSMRDYNSAEEASTKGIQPKAEYKTVILDGKEVKRWVKDKKLYDENPDAVEQWTGKGHEFSGDGPKKEFSPEFIKDWNEAAKSSQAIASDKSYKYKGTEYKKLDDGQYYWKSKAGSWIKAKNFNDDFVQRNGLDNKKSSTNKVSINKSNTKPMNNNSSKEDVYEEDDNISEGIKWSTEYQTENKRQEMLQAARDRKEISENKIRQKMMQAARDRKQNSSEGFDYGLDKIKNFLSEPNKPQAEMRNRIQDVNQELPQRRINPSVAKPNTTYRNPEILDNDYLIYKRNQENNRLKMMSQARLKEYEEIGEKAYYQKYPEDFSKSFGRRFQSGGQVQTEDMMPFDPNQLDKVSENLVQFDGNSHAQGGIKTPAGEFDRQETVLKPGAVGNEQPFAYSDNLKLSKDTIMKLGLPKQWEGKTVAEASKNIENKYQEKVSEDKLKSTTKGKMKEYYFRKLMEANKIETVNNREMNGIQSKEDLTFDELNGNQYQTGNWVNGTLDGKPLNMYERTNDSFMNTPDVKPQNGFLNGLRKPIADNTSFGGTQLNPSGEYPNIGQVPTKEINLNYKAQPDYQFSNNQKIQTPNGPLSVNSYSRPKDNNSTGISSMSDLEKLGLGSNLLGQIGQLPFFLKNEKIPTQYNQYQAEILNKSDNKIDLQKLLDKQNNLFVTQMKNVGDRSYNVNRGLQADMFGKQLDADQQLGMSTEMQNIDLRNKFASVLDSIGQQNVGARNLQEDLQSRTNAAQRNAITQMIGNVGNNVSDFAFTKDNAEKTTQEGLKILNTAFPDFGFNANTSAEFYNVMSDPKLEAIKTKFEAGEYKGEDGLARMIAEAKTIDQQLAGQIEALKAKATLSKKAITTTETQTK